MLTNPSSKHEMSGCCLTPRGKLGSLCDDDTTNESDGMKLQLIHLKSFEVHV